MMIRMLVIDLDRTLLRTDKTISAYSANVLNRCRERGVKVVFATARPVRTVAPYLTQVHCDAVIYHNGAFTLTQGKQIGVSFSIPNAEARRLIAALQQKYPRKKISLEMNDTLYANFNVNEFWSYTNAVDTDFSDLPGADADKIIVEISSPEEYSEVASLLSADLYGEMSDGKLCLILNKNATKFNAIRQLSAVWGIPLAEAAAFGDDCNDIEMVQSCGLGVAVSNAIAEVLTVAKAVAGSNDEDGVAHYIAKHIL